MSFDEMSMGTGKPVVNIIPRNPALHTNTCHYGNLKDGGVGFGTVMLAHWSQIHTKSVVFGQFLRCLPFLVQKRVWTRDLGVG